MFHFYHRFTSTLLVYLICSVTAIPVFAQRPPTGGASPEEGGPEISPVVFIVGGVAIAGATYALVKAKGPKLPVTEHLRDHLLKDNILPNTDAFTLMYSLNPGLEDAERVRAKKRLLMPDFPEFEGSQPVEGAVAYPDNLPNGLISSMDLFETSRDIIEKMSTQSTMTIAQKMDQVNSIVNQVEQEISSTRLGHDSNNPLMDQLVFDLLSTFNQTLERIIANKNANEEDLTLLQNIASNLSEIVTGMKMLSENQMSGGPLPLLNLSTHDYVASIDDSAKLLQKGLLYDRDVLPLRKRGLYREFAFAVYKFSESGQLITKGPEVEGRYKIKYVLPALKNIPNAYHSLRDPATYAVANFPPAKIFIVVEDFSGNPVAIQDQLIDFKVVYNNPQLVNPEKKIIVPLYLTK
jgi:hypothetical protein